MTQSATTADAAQLSEFVKSNSIHTFKVGAVDLDGLWRGKRISAESFLDSVSKKGTFISNILFGWDIQDEIVSGLAYTGWHSAFPDLNLMPDMSTLALVPWEPGTASVICDMNERDGSPVALSPRNLLAKMADRAASLGFEAIGAYELEFYLFRGSARELARNNWRDLDTVSEGHHTYSVYRDSGTEFLIGEVRQKAAELGIYIEASNSEHGPGQFEVNIRYSGVVKAADNAMLLKHTVKELAARHGYTASFMAKVRPEWAGSSGHVHQSLQTEGGTAVFANADDPSKLSAVGMHYLAGLVEHAPALTAMFLPTVNSYKRTESGNWAGSSATWGLDNRTVAVRAIPSDGPAARVENRIAGADANPYLVLAANLAAGLDGIERELVPPAAITGNAYDLPAGLAPPLPTTLTSAVDELRGSAFAHKFLGEKFIEHYATTRLWEVQQFASTVTEWEIARYLEHI